MNKDYEKTFNTIAYTLIIIVELIYIYVTQNELDDKEKNELVKLGRIILFIVSIYFLINAFIGLKEQKNTDQYKQVAAALLVLIAAAIRVSIKDDNITFR